MQINGEARWWYFATAEEREACLAFARETAPDSSEVMAGADDQVGAPLADELNMNASDAACSGASGGERNKRPAEEELPGRPSKAARAADQSPSVRTDAQGAEAAAGCSGERAVPRRARQFKRKD